MGEQLSLIFGDFGGTDVIILLVAVILFGAGYLLYRRLRKSKKRSAPPPASLSEVLGAAQQAQPQPAVTETVYSCSCGLETPILADFRRHLLSMAKGEPGQHKSSGKKTIQKVTAELWVHLGGDYPCYVLRNNGCFDPDRIPKPIGDLFIMDTSMPEAGPHYIVKELPSKDIIDYDPRREKFMSKETPGRAYRATHWDIIDHVFPIDIGILDKISSIMVYAAFGVLFVFGLIRLGGS